MVNLSNAERFCIRINSLKKGIADAKNHNYDRSFINDVMDKYGICVVDEYCSGYFGETGKNPKESEQ